MAELRGAFKDPLAGLLGACIGGWVPLATSFEAHSELFPRGVTLDNIATPSAFLVLGGLVYSAKTVWQWGRAAFNDPLKATGFVLLLEGVMVFSSVWWLSTSALVYLVTINAIATGCRLACRDAKSVARTPDLDDAEHCEEIAPHLSDALVRTVIAPTASRDLNETAGAAVALEDASDRARALRRLPTEVAPSMQAGPSEAKYLQALEYVTASRRCSKSDLKRRLKIGWATADAIVKRLEEEGAVTVRANGLREVSADLLSADAQAV